MRAYRLEVGGVGFGYRLGVALSAVLYVKDLDRVRVFYEKCFGLSTVQSDEQDFCVLVFDDWELSLVSVPDAVAATIVIANPAQRGTTAPIKLVFDVTSIEGLESVVVAAGGQVDPIDSAWEFRGYRYNDCADPEGNVVQLRQRLRSA